MIHHLPVIYMAGALATLLFMLPSCKQEIIPSLVAVVLWPLMVPVVFLCVALQYLIEGKRRDG